MVISLSLHLYFKFLRKTVGKKIWKFRRSSTLILKPTEYKIDSNSSAKVGGGGGNCHLLRMGHRQAEGEVVENCENSEFQ